MTIPRIEHHDDNSDFEFESTTAVTQTDSTTTTTTTTKQLSKSGLIIEMEESFKQNELFREITEEIQKYVDYQVLPFAQNLKKENIEGLLNAMRRK